LLVLCVLSMTVLPSLPFSPPVHHKLVEDLLQDYNSNVIPIKTTNKSIEIAVGLALIHMEQLSDTGVLSATTWMRMVWNDYRLQWNQSHYGNVSVLRADSSLVWLPDIELYNAADPSQFSLSPQFTGGTNVLIYPDGEVLYIPPVHIKVLCHNFTHSNWPQGEQECNIKLGSWTHDGDILSLSLFNNKDEMDLTDMNPASPLNITKQLGNVLHVKTYPCCPEPYQDLNFRFLLKPQYPLSDPTTIPTLLSHLLGVAVTILLLLLAMSVLLLKHYLCHSREAVSDRRNILDESYSQTMDHF